ncbi:MAG TPA: apolipoprotein N-acyltransferase, partial [Methylomirabilota bacterium]|nr:apolipoprotein N-acyltransferase [Methylomirabilota bacterium]
ADGGRIVDAYDKVRLVPFGEYLPLEPVMASLGLAQLAHGVGGFSAGPGPRTVRIPGLARAGFLVCYEVIFPGRVTDPDDRPAFLVNLTNDAWFGRTPGPYQHLDLARLRAIEEGLPIIRAANSGISAILDPFGRIVVSLDLGVTGVVDGVVPPPQQSTIFSRWGPYLLLTFYVFSVTLVTAGGYRMVRGS